jgi:hypothetical protein
MFVMCSLHFLSFVIKSRAFETFLQDGDEWAFRRQNTCNWVTHKKTDKLLMLRLKLILYSRNVVIIFFCVLCVRVFLMSKIQVLFVVHHFIFFNFTKKPRFLLFLFLFFCFYCKLYEISKNVLWNEKNFKNNKVAHLIKKIQGQI